MKDGRLENQCAIHDLICEHFTCQPHGQIQIKGKGSMEVWHWAMMVKNIADPLPCSTPKSCQKANNMNQQTKRIRVLAIVSLGLIMCCLCINPVYSKAPTTLEVCFHVGRIPLIDPECYPGAPIQPLLHDLFPAGQTTVADVHEAIGQYRVDSNATDFGGKLEVYRFQTKFLLPFEDTIVMKYDGNGLLLGWSVED